MGNLSKRLASLEAIEPACGTCAARPVFTFGEGPSPDACPECGRPIESQTFTIKIVDDEEPRWPA